MTGWLPQIDQQKCTGCGDCVAACPTHALGIIAQKAVITRTDQCNYCAVCEDICPTSAIELPYLICFQSTDLSNKEQ